MRCDNYSTISSNHRYLEDIANMSRYLSKMRRWVISHINQTCIIRSYCCDQYRLISSLIFNCNLYRHQSNIHHTIISLTFLAIYHKCKNKICNIMITPTCRFNSQACIMERYDKYSPISTKHALI